MTLDLGKELERLNELSMTSRARKDWKVILITEPGELVGGCNFGKNKRRFFFFMCEESKLLLGERSSQKTQSTRQKGQDQRWTFHLKIICWLSKCSLKPAAIAWLKGIGGKGKKKTSHKYIPRKMISGADRTFRKVIKASQQAKLCLHELGIAIAPFFAAFPPKSLKPHSPLTMSWLEL